MTVLDEDATAAAAMTYGDLAKGARAIAAGLIDRDILPGDRVALMLPTGTDFFTAFFGILYVGAVPVPIYPPMQRAQIEDYAAPAGWDPSQCRRPHAHHGAGRAQAWFASARAGRDIVVDRKCSDALAPLG